MTELKLNQRISYLIEKNTDLYDQKWERHIAGLMYEAERKEPGIVSKIIAGIKITYTDEKNRKFALTNALRNKITGQKIQKGKNIQAINRAKKQAQTEKSTDKPKEPGELKDYTFSDPIHRI